MKILLAKMFNVAISPVNNIKIFGVTQKNLLGVISALLFLSSICFYPSIQATGPLYTYLLVNASNNANWANNIEASTGPNPTINSNEGSCSSTINFINSQTCVLSDQGIYFTHGTSLQRTRLRSQLIATVFHDHNVNTILIRKYYNMLSEWYVTDTSSYTNYLRFIFPASKSVTFSDVFLSTAIMPNPQATNFIAATIFDGVTFDYSFGTAEDSNIKITTSTWMDISITYEYVQNAVGKLSFQVKFYSQGAEYTMPQASTTNSNPNYDMSQLTEAYIHLNNFHLYDYTLQYFSLIK